MGFKVPSALAHAEGQWPRGSAVKVTRNYPGGESIDPVSVVILPLNESAIALVRDLFSDRLFGEGGLGHAEPQAEDLFLARSADDLRPFLSSVSSEYWANIDVTRRDWEVLCTEHPALSSIPINAHLFDVLDGPDADIVRSELEERPSTRGAIVALEGQLGSGSVFARLAAAALVLQARNPADCGTLGWRAAGVVPPPPDEVAPLMDRVVDVLADVKADDEWRSHAARYGGLASALAEIDWLRAKATRHGA